MGTVGTGVLSIVGRLSLGCASKSHINIPVVSHRNPEIITLEHESIVDHAYIVDSDTQCVIFGVLPIEPLSTDSMRDSMC